MGLIFVLMRWWLWGQVVVAMGASGGGYGATDKPSPRCFLPKHKNHPMVCPLDHCNGRTKIAHLMPELSAHRDDHFLQT